MARARSREDALQMNLELLAKTTRRDARMSVFKGEQRVQITAEGGRRKSVIVFFAWLIELALPAA
jgi:hypothetical protein